MQWLVFIRFIDDELEYPFSGIYHNTFSDAWNEALSIVKNEDEIASISVEMIEKGE